MGKNMNPKAGKTFKKMFGKYEDLVKSLKAKTFLLLFLSLTMAVAAMAEEHSKLLVFLKDGNNVQFDLPTQKPVVNCTHGTMIILLQEDHFDHYVSFERDKIEKLTVELANANAIDDVKSDDGQRIGFDLTRASEVRVRGLRLTDHLQVFSLDGKRVDATICLSNGEATVDLSQNPHGVYVVSVNQRFSFKLMKP
jgi:hypothetical protein